MQLFMGLSLGTVHREKSYKDGFMQLFMDARAYLCDGTCGTHLHDSVDDGGQQEDAEKRPTDG
jgi:hypothetical protein